MQRSRKAPPHQNNNAKINTPSLRQSNKAYLNTTSNWTFSWSTKIFLLGFALLLSSCFLIGSDLLLRLDQMITEHDDTMMSSNSHRPTSVSKHNDVTDLDLDHPIKSNYQSSSPCSLTAVLLDSEVWDYKDNHFWWTDGMESFVQFVVLGDDGAYGQISKSKVCFTFQTSNCRIKSSQGNKVDTMSEEDISILFGSTIYDKMGPLSKEFANTGRIRVHFLDDANYREQPCSKWKKPTNFISSSLYFENEFDKDLDSNHILFFEAQALWCRPFLLDKWKHFAYVGAPWTGGSGYVASEWSKMATFDVPYEKSWSDKAGVFGPLDPSDVSLVGSDRLTLVDKTWMLRAIHSCPQRQLAQLPIEAVQGKKCVAGGRPEAEIYFGCVLRGIGAPMPSTFEGSLFSAKFYWPNTVIERESANGQMSDVHERVIRHYLGDTSFENYIRLNSTSTMQSTDHPLTPISIQTNQMKIKQCPSIA